MLEASKTSNKKRVKKWAAKLCPKVLSCDLNNTKQN